MKPTTHSTPKIDLGSVDLTDVGMLSHATLYAMSEAFSAHALTQAKRVRKRVHSDPKQAAKNRARYTAEIAKALRGYAAWKTL